MGKHFDKLVDVVRGRVSQRDITKIRIDAGVYLSDIPRKAMLFEFPLKKIDILPNSGKDKEEYHRYILDYLKMSQDYGHFMVTPFRYTAIEDPESVVFLESTGGNRYLATTVKANIQEDFPSAEFDGSLRIADVHIAPPSDHPSGAILVHANILYSGMIRGEECLEVMEDSEDMSPDDRRVLSQASLVDTVNDVVAFVQENVYIMDPENFIIRRESNASRQLQRKLDRKNGREQKPRKTIVRPHYVICSEEDTSSFLKSEAKDRDPVMIHPVRGHWKTLVSEKYKKCKGKRISIAQYYRGKGEIEGRNGWNYQVLIKENPVTIISANS